LAPAFAALLIASGSVFADSEKTPPKDFSAFGTLHAQEADAVKSQALDWLRSAGKSDEPIIKTFNSIWEAPDVQLLDKVSQTLALGDKDAAKLLTDAQDLATPAPTTVPQILKDAKKPAFYRANLGLAYAKALTNRRVYEEALDALKTVKAEQVVDPAAYLFNRAVAEHALELRSDANYSIVRLLDDVTDSPERYKTVAALMVYDMLGWQEKDLGSVARKMDNIERRLDLSRGGPTTQEIQKKVVRRLDEMIKELENQASGNCDCNGGNCPNGGNKTNNTIRPSSPQKDSNGGNGGGPGVVDNIKFMELSKVWGNLPEKERVKAMADLTAGMPPKYKAVIEDYFKKANSSGSSND
jgi:hypothetical protein